MSARPTNVSAWAIRGLYVLAAMLVFWPLADLVTNTWPMQPANFRWRYGFAGLLGGFHLTPLFGYVLAMYVAIWRGQPRMLRVVAVLGYAAALLLVLVMIMFPLDTLQVRATRPEGVLPAMTVGAVIAEAKHFTTFVTVILLATGSWITARGIAGAAPSARSERGAEPGVVLKRDAR